MCNHFVLNVCLINIFNSDLTLNRLHNYTDQRSFSYLSKFYNMHLSFHDLLYILIIVTYLGEMVNLKQHTHAVTHIFNFQLMNINLSSYVFDETIIGMIHYLICVY